ncbi:MAG TPA: HEAT repeat domain-containing protein [Gemmatimonadaceae bacterium]|jgi:HEAT repeat protein
MTNKLVRAAVMAALLAPMLHGQGLASRIDGAPAGAVVFSFPARPGVCGNGRSFIQSTNGFYGNYYSGSYITNGNGDVMRTEACQNGPVRVVVDRAGREVISIQTYVGVPVAPAPNPSANATDIGRVSGQQAADYLLDVAAKGEGRVGRDAIFPATLADSAATTARVIAIAKNQALSRDTRRSALSYMNNSVPAGQVLPTSATDAIIAIARDETDNQSVRQQALSVLARLEHGVGIPALEQLSKEQGYTWLAKESIAALSRSGDPRAREFLRTTLQRDDLSDEVQAQVIRSLGQDYSTAQDAALLRSIYPKLKGDRSRNAVITSVGEVGGTENVRWLMDLARNDTLNSSRRYSALEAAQRAGVSTAELIKLFDATADQRLKENVVNLLVRIGDDASINKLVSIIKSETNYQLRRNVINRLSGSDDPRIKQALKDVISR